MSEEIKYDNPQYQRFNESLDSDGHVLIAGYSFSQSSILFEMDVQGYKEAYNDFAAQEYENLKQIVIDNYPACIAYHLRLAERGPNSEDPIQKLGHLKDTWEAITHILHAMVWGEVRKKKISTQNAQVFVSTNPDGSPAFANFNTRRLLSDAVKQRLYNIKAVLTYSRDNSINLKCDQIDDQLLDKLLELQDVRNNTAHHATPTLEEAESALQKVLPLFAEMLDKTRFLGECEILRFSAVSPPDITCAIYRGYSLHREQIKFKLGTDILSNNLYYLLTLGNEQLFLKWEDDIFSLSPFLHYQNDNTGHESYLCLYKGKKNEKYQFEPVKLRDEIAFENKQLQFEAEITEIQNLIL